MIITSEVGELIFLYTLTFNLHEYSKQLPYPSTFLCVIIRLDSGTEDHIRVPAIQPE